MGRSSRPRREAERPGPGPGRGGIVVLLASAVAFGACSSDFKKLTGGGGVADYVVYDLFGKDRDPSYYTGVVGRCHCEETYCYLCGDDPYVVDKNIDACYRLGRCGNLRREGDAQVTGMLAEVLLEDRSALARSAAATSLTRIHLRLPAGQGTQVPDTGEGFLASAGRLEGLYQGSGNALTAPAAREEALRLVTRIGNYRFEDLLTNKNALRFFVARRFLTSERDPALRAAIDEAIAKRARALIRAALEAAVEDPVAQVRCDAIRGLKTIDEPGAVDAVVARLEYETHWLVRMEAIEYLGKVGGRTSVVTLVPLIDDADANVRHKAREALTRIAGGDMGWRRAAWERWALSRDPTLRFGPDERAGDRGAPAAPPAGP